MLNVVTFINLETSDEKVSVFQSKNGLKCNKI